MNEQQRKAMELAHEELKHIKTWCLRSIGIGLVNENVLVKIEEALAQTEKCSEASKPLISDELDNLLDEVGCSPYAVARAIEAAHGIKE